MEAKRTVALCALCVLLAACGPNGAPHSGSEHAGGHDAHGDGAGTLRHTAYGPKTELFAWLQATAGIDEIEMNRTFNNGIGMVVVIDAASAAACAATLRSLGETVFEIGVIAPKGAGASVTVV